MQRLLVLIAILVAFLLSRPVHRHDPRTVLVVERKRRTGFFGCVTGLLGLATVVVLLRAGRPLLERTVEQMTYLDHKDLAVLGMCFFGVIAVTIVGIVRVATSRKD